MKEGRVGLGGWGEAGVAWGRQGHGAREEGWGTAAGGRKCSFTVSHDTDGKLPSEMRRGKGEGARALRARPEGGGGPEVRGDLGNRLGDHIDFGFSQSLGMRIRRPNEPRGRLDPDRSSDRGSRPARAIEPLSRARFHGRRGPLRRRSPPPR